MRAPLALLILNELRGAAVALLWARTHPSPPVMALTALAGLALAWALIWRDLVKPELVARDLDRRLGRVRP